MTWIIASAILAQPTQTITMVAPYDAKGAWNLVNQGYTDIQFQSVGIYATKWILHVPMPSEVAA